MDDDKYSDVIDATPRERFKYLLSNYFAIAGLIAAVISAAWVVYTIAEPPKPLVVDGTPLSVVLVQTGFKISEAREKLVVIEEEVMSSPSPETREAFQGALDLLNQAGSNNMAAISFAIRYEKERRSEKILFLDDLPVSYAYAQEANELDRSIGSIDTLRPYIMLFIIASITIFFFVCVGLFCKTKDLEKLKFADNMLRTIVGFYIGIVTGLLGLPT